MSHWIEGVLHSMGYPGVAFLMFLENVFPPIPSEEVMPLAGFAATKGELALWGVIVVGMLGSVAGAIPLYFLGGWLGAERLEGWGGAHGHLLMLRRSELERARRWFERHAVAAVFLGRLAPGVRSLISIPAGMYRMRLPSFLLWTAAGRPPGPSEPLARRAARGREPVPRSGHLRRPERPGDLVPRLRLDEAPPEAQGG